jgi:thiamine-phosphate pyrophosphorylase
MTDLMDQLKLYLVTDINSQPISSHLDLIARAVKGGVTMVQLREKSSSYAEIKNKALALQQVLRPLNIPLIINDSVELAVEIDAEGVHLGREDMPVLEARKLLGTEKIIGLSIENLEEMDNVNNLPINYVAASAIYPSKTKLNCKNFWGIDGLKQVVERSRHPVIAIGGIKLDHAKSIMLTGAAGIAVVSAISEASDPFEMARKFHKNMEVTGG